MRIFVYNSIRNAIYELVDSNRNQNKPDESCTMKDECDLYKYGTCIEYIISCKLGQAPRSWISHRDMNKLANVLIIFRYNELSRSVEDACSLNELSDNNTILKLCNGRVFKLERGLSLSVYDISYLKRRSKLNSMDQLFSLRSLSERLCTDDMCLYHKDDLSCMEGERCLLREICGKTRDEVREMTNLEHARNFNIVDNELIFYHEQKI